MTTQEQKLIIKAEKDKNTQTKGVTKMASIETKKIIDILDIVQFVLIIGIGVLLGCLMIIICTPEVVMGTAHRIMVIGSNVMII